MKKLLFAALVLIIGCSKDDPAPLAVADFTFSDDAKFAPLAIQFQALTENATKVEWDFGDGNTSTDPNPSHIYTKGGTYQVRLDVFNSEDKKDTKTKSLVVLNIPTKLRIDKITITKLPFSRPNGSGWDSNLTGPDPFIAIDPDFLSQYFEDVTPSNIPLVYTGNLPYNITNFTSTLNWTIIDYDGTILDSEIMANYTFKIQDAIPQDGSAYPSKFTFGSSTTASGFFIDVTWLE